MSTEETRSAPHLSPAVELPSDSVATPGPIPLSPRRSEIPRVVGILAVVFACIGLFGALTPLLVLDDDLATHDLTRADLGAFGTWICMALIPSLLVFALHVAAGIMSIGYRRRAPLMMTLYAVLALALIAADIAVSVVLFGELGMSAAVFDDLVSARIGLDAMATPWPIIALILMNLPQTRRSCVRSR